MILLSFDIWSSSGGHFLWWERIYTKRGRWTPFCRVGKRYKTWLGFWNR